MFVRIIFLLVFSTHQQYRFSSITAVELSTECFRVGDWEWEVVGKNHLATIRFALAKESHIVHP